MKQHRSWTKLLTAVGLIGLCGSNCNCWLWQSPPQPRILSLQPTVEEVIGVVNANNGQINSFSTGNATLSGPGIPTLRANLAFERPKRLRLRAEMMGSSELDVGSNDELFWFWIKRNEPRALFYCRHDQFGSSKARQMIPVDPDWLADALGTVCLDPGLPYQGPYPMKNDLLELRVLLDTPEGQQTRRIVVNGQGLVVEQYLYDTGGYLIASSKASRHRRDDFSGLWMPGVVQIDSPRAKFAMRLDLGTLQINRLEGDPAALFAMPQYPGWPPVDLGDPNLQFAPTQPAARVSLRPRER
ncbi:MAG: hypothetical protein HQ567_02640 [Candidatus Nealsonbacteria bacterium]|nr:hypothetical protein [Candidatus Nealsonbacteria bacterium]